jgi:hypothetical protein
MTPAFERRFAMAELRELAEEIRDRHDLMLKLDLNPEDASEELIWVNAAFRA